MQYRVRNIIIIINRKIETEKSSYSPIAQSIYCKVSLYLMRWGDFWNVPDPVATNFPVSSSISLDSAICKVLPALTTLPLLINGTPIAAARTK